MQAIDLITLGKKLSELTTEELVALNARLVSSDTAVDAEQPPAKEIVH